MPKTLSILLTPPSPRAGHPSAPDDILSLSAHVLKKYGLNFSAHIFLEKFIRFESHGQFDKLYKKWAVGKWNFATIYNHAI